MKDPKRLLPAILFCSFAFALWPSDAAAQRRGHPVRPRSATVVVRPAFHGGYYGYYDPFFWGYSGWYPYGLYAPSYGADAYNRTIGSARLQVTPKHAEVYVDGHLAGTVDDFDGFLQRLDVPAGEHELTLYFDGYRTIQQKVLFRPGATVKITSATPVRVNEQFFIAEPQIDALWRINSWMRLDAGVGYRAIGGADLLHEQLRGVSGTIALRFGRH